MISRMDSIDIAVIGGGYAGLAAARYLEDAGQRVDLYEPRVLGGRVIGSGSSGSFTDLVNPIISFADRNWVHPLSPTEHPDVVLTPFNVGDIRGSKINFGFSKWNPRENWMRLRLHRLSGLMRRYAARLDRSYPERAIDLDDRSAGDFARLYTGKQVQRQRLAPSLRASFSQNGDVSSRCLFLLGHSVRYFDEFGTPAASLRLIANKLSPSVVRIGSTVEHIERSRSGFVLEISGDNAGHREYGAVVVATSGATAAKLAANVVLNAELEILEDTHYAQALMFNAETERSCFQRLVLIRVPFEESRLISRVVLRPIHGTSGSSKLSVMIGNPAARCLNNATDTVLLDQVSEQLERWIPDLKSNLLNRSIVRFQQGFPLFPVGRYRALSRLRALEAERLEDGNRLVFAGDYLIEPSLAGAVLSGTRAARQLLGSISDRSDSSS